MKAYSAGKSYFKAAYIPVMSVFLIFVFFSECNTTEPPRGEKPTLTLKLENVSCTEAWITLSSNLKLPATVELKQNSEVVKTINLKESDSLLYIDSLLPNTSYQFQASSILYRVATNQLQVTTLDTTSHNFTFETYTFGGQTGSCALYDVAIIDENNIWAVGEIYLLDSLGQPDPNRYNLGVWDGNDWEIKRAPYYYQGKPFYHPIQSIFAFSINDIWFCGNGIIHWDGIQYNPISIPTSIWGSNRMNKIWGSSSNDLYVVGDNGNIAHYKNGVWNKIESGTDLALVDLFGDNSEIFIAGSDINYGKGIILRRNNSVLEVFVESEIVIESQLFNPKLYGSIASVWIDDKNTFYAGGNLLFRYIFGRWEYVKSLPENFIGGNPGVYYRGYISSIRGISSNDMWIAGDRNTLRHFNGETWKQIGLPYSPDSDIIWAEIRAKGKIVIAVGSEGNKAIVMLIKSY